MRTEALTLVGAGGHGRVVYEALRSVVGTPDVEIRDDRIVPPSRSFDGRTVLTPAVPPGAVTTVQFHVAIGDNAARRRVHEVYRSRGARPCAVVHCRACVASSAVVAPGAFVAALAVVGPDARLDEGVIVNHAAIVDHDCVVGAFTHVAPGAVLGGGVVLGPGVLFGANAVALPGVVVGARARVGAGAVVTEDVPEGATVVGVPARSTEDRPIRRLAADVGTEPTEPQR
jgi:sugar O-acyltransferase (sialic acid O-acetyltransferase NeuD family)